MRVLYDPSPGGVLARVRALQPKGTNKELDSMYDRFNVDAGLEGTGEIIDPSDQKRKSRQQALAREGTRATVLTGADLGATFGGVSTRRASLFGS